MFWNLLKPIIISKDCHYNMVTCKTNLGSMQTSWNKVCNVNLDALWCQNTEQDGKFSLVCSVDTSPGCCFELPDDSNSVRKSDEQMPIIAIFHGDVLSPNKESFVNFVLEICFLYILSKEAWLFGSYTLQHIFFICILLLFFVLYISQFICLL
jgi:hypothetical protein